MIPVPLTATPSFMTDIGKCLLEKYINVDPAEFI
jgi:hypothetical protein